LKKICLILLAVLLIASLAGCKQPDESSADTASENTSSQQEAVSENSVAASAVSSKDASAAKSSATTGSSLLDDTASLAQDIMSTLSELDDVTESDIAVPNP